MEKLRLTSQRIFEFDENLCGKYDCLIGCDEAGRGPGAGPLYVAAVYFPNLKQAGGLLLKLNDSKKLTEKTREVLYPVIKANSVYSICRIEIEKIEEINILNASLLGMANAARDVILKTGVKNPLVLVDGNKLLKNFDYFQRAVIKGDSTSASIAAASVLAKVSRDNFMLELDKKFPAYNFKKNKGYLTKEHIEAIHAYGISEVHRKSFLTKV